MASLLVVSEIFYPEGGGAEQATYLILKLLSQNGFKITVVTGAEKPVKIPGVKYYITPYLRFANRLTRFKRLKLLANTQFFNRLIREHNILYIPLGSHCLVSLAKKKKMKVVVHLHNYAPVRYSSVKYFFEPYVVGVLDEFRLAVFHEYYAHRSLTRTLLSPLPFLIYLLERKFIEEADKIICVSHRQAEIVARNNPRLANKIEVVYNPLPLGLLESEPRKELDDTPTFLYVGGDSYMKGFHVLLQVIKMLGKREAKAKFILAGKYGFESFLILRQLGERYRNLEINVEGKIEYSELIKLHQKAWALIFPSICEEPLPYAVAEAAALGTVPIATKVGGVVELLSDTIASKYMFAPGMYAELFEKLVDLSFYSVNEVKALGLKLRKDILTKLDQREIMKKMIQAFKD